MSEWKEIPLSETTKFIVDNRGKTAPTVPKGIPLIATNCINNRDLYPKYENLRYVSKEIYDSWFRSHPKPGDIILTLKGSQNGAVCLVPNPVNFVIAQDMVALRANENIIDPLFLFAALRTPEVQIQIKNMDVSGVIPHFKKSDFDKLLLPYPKKHVQKEIGNIYFSLSNKIDLLHRQNTTLEKMAETLFRQWFVEEAKEDWKVVELGSVVETTSGGTPSRSNMKFYEDGTIYWVKSKELNGSFILETEEKITIQALKKSSAKILPANSILIAMYGATVGEYAIMSHEMACNQAICALKPNHNYPYTYLFLLIKYYKEELINMAVGSAQQNISQLLIKKLPVLACIERINEFHSLVNPNFEKIKSNHTQIKTLTALRDTLLPKLMSGEVRME